MRRRKEPKRFSQPYQCYMLHIKHYSSSSYKLIAAVLSRPPSSSKCIYTKNSFGGKKLQPLCVLQPEHMGGITSPGGEGLLQPTQVKLGLPFGNPDFD